MLFPKGTIILPQAPISVVATQVTREESAVGTDMLVENLLILKGPNDVAKSAHKNTDSDSKKSKQTLDSLVKNDSEYVSRRWRWCRG